MNVVSSVGYGDMFPINSLEQMVIIFMINLGDALFAVAFGTIAAIFMHFSQNSDTEHFFEKMSRVMEFSDTF